MKINIFELIWRERQLRRHKRQVLHIDQSCFNTYNYYKDLISRILYVKDKEKIMNLLLLEDDVNQAKALKEIISDYKDNWEIHISNTYEEAKQMSEDMDIDIFLLDIELGINADKTGLDFAEEIRLSRRYSNVPIIFITAYKEQIYKAINSIHCYNYIVKPYTISSIRKSIDDFENYMEPEMDYINIKDSNGIYYTLYYKDIIYIEASGHDTLFHTNNGRFIYCRHSLVDVLDELDDRFVRIHKKYIINCEFVKNYDKTTLLVNTGKESLSVGRQYKINFETAINITKQID